MRPPTSPLGFALLSSSIVLAILGVCWAFTGFSSFGLDGNETVALILGITFTTGIGCGLMGLLFASERDGRDDLVFGRNEPHLLSNKQPCTGDPEQRRSVRR